MLFTSRLKTTPFSFFASSRVISLFESIVVLLEITNVSFEWVWGVFTRVKGSNQKNGTNFCWCWSMIDQTTRLSHLYRFRASGPILSPIPNLALDSPGSLVWNNKSNCGLPSWYTFLSAFTSNKHVGCLWNLFLE